MALLVGWKVMASTGCGSRLTSGADGRLGFPAREGQVLEAPAGIWLSLQRDHVLAHYAVHEHNALLELTFDGDDLLSGSLEDRETELCVRSARIRAITLFAEDLPPEAE